MTIQELAIAIDKFAYDYDPYEYGDSVEDKEKAVEQLAEYISKGDCLWLIDWLQSIIDEEDESMAEATALRNTLKNFVL